MEEPLGDTAPHPPGVRKERLQVLNLIQDITDSDFGGYQAVLALHAEGSMEAEKLQLYREYDWQKALAFARKMARMEKAK